MIGGSIVRHQNKKIVKFKPNHRRRICHPGGRITDITQICCDEIKKFSATGNDFLTKFIKNYENLIETYQEKGKKIKILPGLYDQEYWYDYTFCANQKLKLMCEDLKILFIETLKCFDRKYDIPKRWNSFK